MKTYTLKQVNKKFYGRYIEFRRHFDYETREYIYEVNKVFKNLHENTTLGQDVGTSMEYCR